VRQLSLSSRSRSLLNNERRVGKLSSSVPAARTSEGLRSDLTDRLFKGRQFGANALQKKEQRGRPLHSPPLAIAQQAYLKASNPGSSDQFAHAVAVLGDTVVVGARWEDSNAVGVNGNQSSVLEKIVKWIYRTQFYRALTPPLDASGLMNVKVLPNV
jgi:hypothetical protein